MNSFHRILLPNPRDKANCLSRLSFWWTIEIFRKGFNKVLDVSDIFGPINDDASNRLGDRLESNWRQQQQKSKPSLTKSILQTFKKDFIFLGLITIVNQIVKAIVLPLVIGRLLLYFRQEQYIKNVIIAGILIVGLFFVIVTGNKIVIDSSHLGMKIRVAVCSLIYRKSLKISQTGLNAITPGKIINLLSTDVNRFDIVTIFIHSTWLAPIISMIIIYFLWLEAKWAGMVGALLILIVAPTQSYSGTLSAKFRTQISSVTDERVRLMDEVISAAKVIKMYTWEKPFAKLIQIIRHKELKAIRKNAYLRGTYMTLMLFTNRVAMFATMVTLVVFNEQLTASKVFIILAYYNSLSTQMSQLFVRGYSEIIEVLVVIKRLTDFLECDEHKADGGKQVYQIKEKLYNDLKIPSDRAEKEKLIDSFIELPDDIAISIRNATVNRTLAKQNEFTLQNINLDLKKGALICIIGPVGAGKSSLLYTILNELEYEVGSVTVNGKISYAPQDPWLFSGTVKQNILFGEELLKTKYDTVVKACALMEDLEQLPQGDNSIVGDKGATLSGGQKARINLARAIYRKADIYLFDDPLSAVDSQVCKHLFNSVIGPNGILSKSTRILVTHQIQVLPEADFIVVIKNGCITFQGAPQELKLLAEPQVKFDDAGNHRSHSKSKLISCESINNDNSSLNNNLESSSKFDSNGSTTIKYFRCATSKFRLLILFILFLTTQIFASTIDWWVSYWTEQEELRSKANEMYSTLTYIYIYSFLVFGLPIIAFTRSIVYYNTFINVSRKLHDEIFRGVMSSPLRFFNTNTVGRILNRFAKDIATVDELLPKSLLDTAQLVYILVGICTVIAFVNPIFLIPLSILGVGFLYLRKIFLKTSKNLKRIEALTRSPGLSYLASTLNGLSTIRALQASDCLIREFDSHQDLHIGAWFMYITSNSAFGFALEFICFLLIVIVILTFLMVNVDVSAEKVGLVITQALFIPEMMQWCIRQSADVSNYMTSVERVLEYCDLPTEINPNNPIEVSRSWPLFGKIEFQNTVYRHFAAGEAVLNNFNLVIMPGEKLGIVGRTGAGKSSVISAIFRLGIIEGNILIDGIDTSKMLLSDMRSKISIIPQEPVLFSGTLRKNLDPFEEIDDNILWQVLEDVNLKTITQAMGLDSIVHGGGVNFSVGQRQLICLARAILRNNKILILDEATANVDTETDNLIQYTIRKKFHNCTVITITHRLHTIIDSDRILVLNTGKIEELAIPLELIHKENSQFRKMIDALGQHESERLIKIISNNRSNKKSKLL